MVPMLDTMLTAPGASVILSVGPAAAGVALAVIVGLVWVARGTRGEVRQMAAREAGRPENVTASPSHDRLAA